MAQDGKRRRALTVEEWLAVRAEWERTGASLKGLAQKWGVAIETITKRKKAQVWRRDPTNEVERRVVRKVAEKTAAQSGINTTTFTGGNSQPVEVPPTPVALTPDEVIERTAEERAAVIMRHQQEWRDFAEVRLAAVEVFFKPDYIETTVIKGDKTYVRRTPDYSKIALAKTLADTLLVQHRGERAAHNLEHNLNQTRAQDLAKRDEMIRETFAAIRDAATQLKEAEEAAAKAKAKTIDITPNK
jgi:virulence-associated protein VagC